MLDRPPEGVTYKDETLTCVNCRQPFVWFAGEQAYCEVNGYRKPRRCRPCREARRNTREAAEARRQKRAEAALAERTRAALDTQHQVEEERKKGGAP